MLFYWLCSLEGVTIIMYSLISLAIVIVGVVIVVLIAKDHGRRLVISFSKNTFIFIEFQESIEKSKNSHSQE